MFSRGAIPNLAAVCLNVGGSRGERALLRVAVRSRMRLGTLRWTGVRHCDIGLDRHGRLPAVRRVGRQRECSSQRWRQVLAPGACGCRLSTERGDETT